MALFWYWSCVSSGLDDTSQTAESRTYEHDEELRITDGQVWGTHNSYHIAPSTDAIAEWNYTHPPLDEQLTQGIRQFEIDVVFDPDREEVVVQHIPILDDQSNCDRFVDCLQTIRDWSDAHPWHFPIQVLVEPKDEVAAWDVTEHLDDVDEQIRSVLADRIWTPDMQKGDFATLRDSVLEDGWPTLETLRGHVVFALLDRGNAQRVYTRELSDISDRVMFPLVDPEHDFAAYFLRDDPFQAGVSDLVQQGFLIRTRGDAGLVFDQQRLDQAFAIGAHAISVDTQDSLNQIDVENPVSCNPLRLSDCLPTHLE